jgi:hypothetical protein
MLATLVKLAIAGAVLAGICFAAQHFFFVSLRSGGELRLVVQVCLTIVLGAGAFFGCAYFLRVAEVEDVVNLARRKLKF